jgi:YegS/Rv2252/BmrU family lipid kinase
MRERCVLLNPHAGRGTALKKLHVLVPLLHEARLPFDLVFTPEDGGAVTLAAELLERGYREIIVAGGDGTLHEVVQSVVRSRIDGASDVTLGIVALGTGNDFVKSLYGVRREPLEQTVQRLAAGNTRMIDAGLLDITTSSAQWSCFFLNDVGLGIYAQVALETLRVTRLRGWSVYTVAVLRALAAYKAAPLHIHFKDQALLRPLLLACITNGCYQGAGFCLAPDALLDDGLLDVCTIDAVPLWKILRHLPGAMRGTHTQEPQVTIGQSTHATIASDSPFLVASDGEIMTREARRIEVRVLPQALRVLV